MTPIQAAEQQVTSYSFKEVGYPYIYAGEWNAASPPGYCCGYQPKGGFDCSGFAWWVMKQYEKGYNAAQYRTYPGWSLLERSSSQMAEYTDQHIAFASLQPGDLMFFASNKGKTWQDVDHVGIFLGNGWMHPFDQQQRRGAAGPDRLRAGALLLRHVRVRPPAHRRMLQSPRGPDGEPFVVTKQTLLMGDAR